MTAIILSVGDELISGQSLDTNSAWLARCLGELGVAATEHRTVADDRREIAQALTAAAAGADVVLVTGGLGPTADDLTRQGLADAMGVELLMDHGRLAEIEAFFRNRGRTMQPANRIQAMVPAGAASMPNPLGTAPGIAARLGRADVYLLPGVPHEMQRMFDERVAPHLAGHGAIVHRSVHCFGQGESDIAATIADLMQRGRNPLVGTTASTGVITVRIAARGASRPEAQDLAERTVEEVRQRLGTLVVGTDEQTMPAAVGHLLRQARATLATAESCTGGLLGELVTSVAGSSDYYRGGVVAYANDTKCDLLAVPAAMVAQQGAVSEPVAAAMAEGCRKRLGADWALSVTGIAGPGLPRRRPGEPGGGSEDKPVGLIYVALAGAAGTRVHRHVLAGTREIVRLRAALTALNHLRLALMGQANPSSE